MFIVAYVSIQKNTAKHNYVYFHPQLYKQVFTLTKYFKVVSFFKILKYILCFSQNILPRPPKTYNIQKSFKKSCFRTTNLLC